MNKTKKICRLGLVLSVFIAAALSLVSCAQKDDGDYFKDSVGTYKWNETFTALPVYKHENFGQTFADETSTEGLIAIIKAEFPNQKDYWSYFVYYVIDYYDENGQFTGKWGDRKVYVKTKTDALKVYDEILEYKDELLEYGNTYAQYYGIDYDPEILMSNDPVVYEVKNMDGKTFSKSEVLYSFWDGNNTETKSKVYEERTVCAEEDENGSRISYFQIADINDPKSGDWKYFVHFHTNWYNSDGDWVTSIGREVYCKTKSDAKKVFKDMMDYYKEDSDAFIGLNPDTNERFIGQSYGYDYNLKNLIK